MAQGNQRQRRNLAAYVFRRNYTDLHDAVSQHDVASGLAIKLYSGAIITLETRDAVQTPSFTPAQQANFLLRAVESSIKIDHTRLRKFTRLLKKQPVLKPIAKQLRQCYRERVAEARLTESSSSGSDTDSTEQHQSQAALLPTGNWQYQELSRKSADVTTALAANKLAGILAGHLKARGIIGQPVFEQATNYAVGVTEYARVEHLVTAVLTKTKYNPQCYHDFVNVLKVDGLRPDTEAACSLLPAGKDSASTAIATTPTTPGDHQHSSPAAAAEATLCSTVVETSKVSVQLSESEIDREIPKLERQFLKVVREAGKDLRTFELSEVKDCVTQLPVSVKYQHLCFLERNLSAISSAQNVDAILAILGRYWDYLNCGLLSEVVHQLGRDQTKQLMEQYTGELRQFRMKTKLGDFFGKATQVIPPHFTTFITEMGSHWRDRTLEDLEEFRKKLAHSMYLKEYAMHFKSAETGSVAVTWAFHSSLPAITDVLQSAFQLLEKKYSILRVIFQGNCIPEPKSLEFPPSATPPAPLPMPTPRERSELETNTQCAFDMIAALLSAGVPHIVEQILQSLDVKSLVKSEQVSSTWRDVIADLHMWKHLIKHKIDSDPLWRALFKKRGWHKYLDMPPAEQMSRQFYRQLHDSACRDLHSLEANWRRGHYTLTRVETGNWINCLQYDDDKIVTGHDDSTIKIWDRSTLQLLKVWRGHKREVECLQFNEKVVISGSYDHTVKVWDIMTGQVTNDLLHHKDVVRCLKFTTDTLVTGSYDRTVAVWDIKSPTDITLKMTLKGHKDWVMAVDMSETTIISGSQDKTIKVWDSSSGELLRTLRGHSDWVHCLQLLGSHLISGSYDDTIRTWNIDTGECIRVLHGHKNNVTSVAVDNKRILSGSLDKTIKVWDLAAALDPGSSSDTLCITTLKGHTDWVYGIQFDNFQVISGSHDGTILIHNFLDPTPPTLRA